MKVRVATSEDLDGVTATLTVAFERDPLWSWVFPDPRDLEVWWRFHIKSALRYPWVLVGDDYAAAALWIPPDGTELTEEEEAAMEPLLGDLIGERAPGVLRLLERFDASHPRQQSHYYLSLLGTHSDHRGKGLGMGLLSENLARIDAEHLPGYLESSNPGNDKRYQRLGFRRTGEFSTPDETRVVGTMWRDAR